jgi:type I restriction enzyme S subunit
MSHHKPYPAYKDSGVEWIGQIPEHWTVPALKFLVAVPITDGPHETPTAVAPDQGVLFISAEAVASGKIEFQKSWGYISRADHMRYSKKYKPAINDIYMVKSGATTGVTVIVEDDREFNIWSPLAAIRANDKVIPRFLLNALRSASFRDGVALNWSYGTQQNIGMGVLKTLQTPLPTFNEQCAIVATLDRETARIDALIAKKSRFIELLKEKRQALITHAVTKGLDPNVGMKDSGVEWIGEVPAHWNVAQIGKVAVSRCDGPFGTGLKSEHYTEVGVRVVRLQNIGWAEFKEAEAAFIAPEYWRDELGAGHDVLTGDVLMAGLGDDKNPLGRACVAPPDIGEAMVKADCYRFRMGPRTLPEYVALALSATSRAECGFLATGATRDRLNLTLASARVIPLPSIDEQREVVRNVSVRASRIDLLISKTEHSIALLKERRAALITAAVTGQIDLRSSAANEL